MPKVAMSSIFCNAYYPGPIRRRHAQNSMGSAGATLFALKATSASITSLPRGLFSCACGEETAVLNDPVTSTSLSRGAVSSRVFETSGEAFVPTPSASFVSSLSKSAELSLSPSSRKPMTRKRDRLRVFVKVQRSNDNENTSKSCTDEKWLSTYISFSLAVHTCHGSPSLTAVTCLRCSASSASDKSCYPTLRLRIPVLRA